nr:RepB family DNA primase [Lachnospiraceae bacterium]
MIIGPLDILKTMFNVDEIVNMRVFDDKKGGIFKGAKIPVELNKYATVEQQLKDHNALNRGVFFVVNYGGDDDKSITRINAQFVEMDDGTFAEQWEKIQKFPLEPSIVNQTQKSLHVYWLIKDGEVPMFRSIQKGLVKHFAGDPACVNESRCMRLPGFNHCKKDTPVMVECKRFNPQLQYTQEEIIAALGDDYVPDANQTSNQSSQPTGTEMGLELVVNTCEFIKHCNTNAASLSEPMWYAEVTNLAPFEGGRDAIHKYSAPYPGYDKAKTDDKIDHFLSSGTGPMTCEKIKELGFTCPKMANGECTCKAPAAKCYQALDVADIKALLTAQPVKSVVVEDMQTAQKFVSDYMYNLDTATAETLIKYDIKDHFKFKVGDLKPLLDAYKQVSKDFQTQKAKKAQASQMGQLPPWYSMSDKGPKFMPDVLADHCAKNKFVFCIGEDFYLYNNGVYRPLSEERAKNMIREEMLMGYTKLSQINDSTAQWRMQIQKDAKDLNTNPFFINLRN